MKLDSFFFFLLHTHIHTQLNVKYETARFLEENKGKNLLDIDLDNSSMDMTP